MFGNVLTSLRISKHILFYIIEFNMENNHNTSTKRFKRKQNNDYTEQEHKM